MPFSPPERTNDEWLTLLRRLDPDAFQDLEWLCRRVSQRILGTWPEADPELAAAEARDKVLAELNDPAFTIEYSFIAFVCTVVSRHCYDVRRKIQRAREQLPTTSLKGERIAAPDSPQQEQEDSSVDQRPEVQALRNCMGQLDPRDQQIVHWAYVAGQGPSWIAAHIDPPMTPNYVSVRRNRALLQLKRCLAQAGF